MPADGAQPLRVDLREQDGLPVIAPSGEVDIASVPALNERFDALLSAGSVKLIVDLAGLTYIDSTGLGALAAARRRAREAGGDLRVVCVNERILRLFAITGLDQVFAVCRTVAEAAAALAEGG